MPSSWIGDATIPHGAEFEAKALIEHYLVGWIGDATYWPVKPFVEAAGLNWSAQRQRIDRDSTLKQGVVTLTIPSLQGGVQSTLCLPWHAWHAFWTGVEAGMVNDQARPAVLRFQEDAYAALALVFGATAEEVLRDTLCLPWTAVCRGGGVGLGRAAPAYSTR